MIGSEWTDGGKGQEWKQREVRVDEDDEMDEEDKSDKIEGGSLG